ncbi:MULTISPECIES: hypothetical protein [Nocardioides]|uniref:hypothetical protein n=1 Tax=Nocardioides TaxID=1839 RepID=UPI00187A058C|nr:MULTISPECIES: hypothetical protein [Nocardioides]MBJ7530530.1 hypothetical protein [Nocardioides sp.]MCM3516131.1 hypothetical protein [Nocardioides sp. P86]
MDPRDRSRSTPRSTPASTARRDPTAWLVAGMGVVLLVLAVLLAVVGPIDAVPIGTGVMGLLGVGVGWRLHVLQSRQR